MSAKYTTFPDGSQVPDWFNHSQPVDVDQLGTKYVITDYGVVGDSTIVQTEAIQRVIDLAAEQGGGVVVIPEGTY
ncbi:MAG: exopolygalacturonase, partial [Muribaculaceae bacterium]|nr:exopolygalacturonase [Muribaculaceae bacterium]